MAGKCRLYSKNTTDCTDWELTKLIDTKRQEYANNKDKVSHYQRLHLKLALDHGSTETLCKINESLLIRDLKPTLNENLGSEKLYLYY